jgi:hypothetical protein
MRKHRIERNLAFPSEEFRAKVRTAAKERGFRTEQAFLLAACEHDLERGYSTEAMYFLGRLRHAGQDVLQEAIGKGDLCVHQSEERLHLPGYVCEGRQDSGLKVVPDSFGPRGLD